uniref:Musculoskeletal embryonic nuclear protein 1 n=1 Tax=Esox lucius TaxID=8010 RepID=A0AAY5KF78_ESOLU
MLGWTGQIGKDKAERLRQRAAVILAIYTLLQSVVMSQPEDGEEGQLKRPEVSAEDLIGAKDNLSSEGKLKGKTIQVMEECAMCVQGERPSSTSPKLDQSGSSRDSATTCYTPAWAVLKPSQKPH